MSGSSARRGRRQRGASAVEYALGLGVLVAVLIPAVGLLQNRARDDLGTSSDVVGTPIVAGTPTTNPAHGTTPTTPPPDPTPVVTGKSCTGDTCTFTLSPDVEGATWTVTPNTPSSGVQSGAPPGETTFKVPGGAPTTFTISATASGFTITPITVTCTKSGPTTTCV